MADGIIMRHKMSNAPVSARDYIGRIRALVEQAGKELTDVLKKTWGNRMRCKESGRSRVLSYVIISTMMMPLLFTEGCISPVPIPPMHKAVRERNISEINALLDNGARINANDDLGRTPLYLASLYGYADVVDLLLSRGAKIEKGASWKNSDTPLHVASDKGYVDIVQLLVAKGADVNAKNTVGKTPLQYAAWRGRASVVDFLLAHGADLRIQDQRGRSALNHDQGSLDSKEGYESVVRILISHGADVNNRTSDGFTPLMGAARIGDLSAAALLIDHGAVVNIKCATGLSGYTPLHIATAGDHAQVVKLLVDHGADINATNDVGETALIIAKKKGYEEIVAILSSKEKK